MQPFTVSDFQPGDRVRAFHPARFGVVNYATVTKVGRKVLLVDFGPLLGASWNPRTSRGIFRVRPSDVVEKV